MKNVLVTGAAGFIGRNLLTALQRRENVVLSTWIRNDDRSTLYAALDQADVVFHLAGVNRPENEEEFTIGNNGLTEEIIQYLQEQNKSTKFILSSSTQAAQDNPYGKSKKAAEDVVLEYNRSTGAQVAIYRLPGVFGKWSRPNYNTVVATFCHNIARGLEISISNPNHELELVYIDDVVKEFLRHLDANGDSARQRYTVARTFRVTLEDLAERIHQLHAIRQTLLVPDLADDFMKCLYATYLSFLPGDDFASPVTMRRDKRGWLFELIKSEHFGQIFVSKTLPGITRGDHYHDTKLEKFCVIQGRGVIRFRHIHSTEILEYPVDDTEVRVVDIPPGYTHSIENNGNTEMICLFWANHVFDPEHPDTFWEKVKA
ncbi:MAG: NAD-dependent epimerase/dehydratase family protein [Candidatus Electrothrix gigas]